MLQLVRLGQGHVHTDLYLRFRLRIPALPYTKQPSIRGHHFADALMSLPIAEQDRLAGLQPQHLRMLGIFSGEAYFLTRQFL